MQQVALIQSGCQQWIKQPAAIHGNQFAFSSSLAVFVHASDDYRLLRVLAQQTQHINALSWSPVDANLIACSNAEKVIRVYSLESDAALYTSKFPYTDTVSSLCWAMHDESMLLAAAGNIAAYWSYKSTSGWRALHTFRACISCMQQSATEPRLLAVGCSDASVHLFDMLLQKVVCTVKLEESAPPCDLQFDPLSKSYLLLLCGNGAIALYAVSNNCSLDLVSSLAKQPAAPRSAAFVPNAPGNFAVISSKSGTLQLWNVSQQQPLHSLKVGNRPAQSLKFFPGSSRALITFQDGIVMVYDVATHQQLWCTQPGHTETIFDCCFAPGASHLLATCSFDGTVRVWNAATHCCIKTLDTKTPGRDEVVYTKGVPSNALYSICWSPAGDFLAASSAGGAVYLFDVAKGIAVKKWQLHTKPSLKVTWHPTKPSLLASSSMDGSVVVFQTDGSKVKVLQHSSAASGCAWASDGYLLATTTEAGAVYVWDMTVDGEDCLLQSLMGHAKRSFSVLWSPLLPHLLLSGSDDATARVWDTRSGSCVALLAGHKTEVRALCWHPELPWLVLTGSWDSTICCWDWSRQTVMYTCTQHHSDVYGLSIQSSCPFLLASASRDSTLRLWSLRGLGVGLFARCLLLGAVPHGQADVCQQQQEAPLLCGPAPQQLADWLASHCGTDAAGVRPADLSPTACVELFQRLSALFMPPGPAQALWQLAAAVAAHLPSGSCSTTAQAAGADEQQARSTFEMPATRLSNAHSLCRSVAGSMNLDGRANSIGGAGAGGSCCCLGPGCLCHLAKVRSGLVNQANQLELSVRGRGASRACIGAARMDEVLQEAAMLHLQAGEPEKCCELLVELGAWDRALALAPAVSQSYWRQLLQRKAEDMTKAEAPIKEVLPLMLAAGQVGPVVELLLQQKEHDLAGNIASVAACGGYNRFIQQKSDARSSAGSPAPPLRSNSLLSPTATPTAQAAGAAALLGPTSAFATTHSVSGLHPLPAGQSSGPGLTLAPLAVGPLPKKNSLPPLRATASASISCDPVNSPAGAGLTALPGAGSGPGATGSLSGSSMTPLGAASRSGSCGGISLLPHGDQAAASQPPVSLVQLAQSPTEPARLSRQHSGGLRQSCGHGRGPGAAIGANTDDTAMSLLSSVFTAQMQLHRLRGQPIKAACAALTLHDVPAAVAALHRGHEPEQAAMLCMALGRAVGLQDNLVDRVFEALAIKCEAAGDWCAAALALGRISIGAQQQQQLLVVRQERGRVSMSDNSGSNAAAGAACMRLEPTNSTNSSSLRQHLGLHSADHYAVLAKSAVGAEEAVRYLLLALEHGHAAAKAITSMQPLLADLEQQVLHSIRSTTTQMVGSHAVDSTSPLQNLLSSPTVMQLLRWHVCLESLDATALPLPCWQDVFAHILLTGALKAFAHEYQQVGSFLLARLRHWTEQHGLLFPLSRSVLLLLEAGLMQDSNPESGESLMHAALGCAGATAETRAVAELGLQALAARLPRATSPAAPDSSCVIASHSSLPQRPPPVTMKRSAVSGKLLGSVPWAFADDGCSLLSHSEAVMLSHVMRWGPCGTGLVVQLLV